MLARVIIGHYAVAFVASRTAPTFPLWQSMIAVVWMDILHSSLVIVGVERAEAAPGITAVVPIDLIHYPYSHSLVAAVLWSLLAFVIARAINPAPHRNRVALFMAVSVFSHFVLDLVAHRPDLPILSGEPKFGFGLWNYMVATYVIENAILFGSLWFYARAESVSRTERIGLTVLCLVGSALFFLFPVVAFPPDIRYTEAVALIVYALVPWVAFMVKRRPAVATA